MKRAWSQLSNIHESSGLLLHSRYLFGVGTPVQLDFRTGPVNVKKWTPEWKEEYFPHGFGFTLFFQTTRFIKQCLSFEFFFLYETAGIRRFIPKFKGRGSLLIPWGDVRLSAIRSGDLEYVQRSISLGKLSPEDISDDASTLLHIAALHDQAEMITMLIDLGASVNAPNCRGETALHIVVKKGSSIECARRLLDKEADICHPDISGRTPGHTSLNPVVLCVLQYNILDLNVCARDVSGKTVLHYLSWTSHPTRPIIEQILSAHYPEGHNSSNEHEKWSFPLCIKDEEGKSVLHYAAQRGNLDLVQFLLRCSSRATMSMKDHCGRSLLHYATETSRMETFDMLLSEGFDMNATDNQGRTILHHACQWGPLNAVQHIVDQNFSDQLDREDENGLLPLDLAIQNDSPSVIEYIRGIRLGQFAS